MAIAITHPQSHQNDYKRATVVVAAAIIAAVLMAVAVQTVSNDTNTLSAASSELSSASSRPVETNAVAQRQADMLALTTGVVDQPKATNPAAAASTGSAGVVTTTAAIDTGALADWARSNGLTGSSPTSIGATGSAVAPTDSAAAQRHADVLALTGGLVNPPTATHIGGYDMSFSQVYSQVEALRTNVPDTSTQGTQRGGFANHAQFVEANVDNFAVTDVTPANQIGGLEQLYIELAALGANVPGTTTPATSTNVGGPQ